MRLLQLALLCAATTLAFADEPPASVPASIPATAPAPAPVKPDLGGDPRDFVGLEEVGFRFALYTQDGHGFQSPAGPAQGPGSEEAVIYQPQWRFRLRAGRDVYHDVVIPVDIVSAASPDAIDALSSASALNEAGGADVLTHVQLTRVDAIGVRYGFHIEEPFRSANLGVIYSRSLADDNATIETSLLGSFDYFDNLDHLGYQHGQVTRFTLNYNLSASQILSPTTIVDGSYGLTLQRGTLQTTYNGVPVAGATERVDELFPDSRLRHAFAVRLAQHIPATRSTLKLGYRFYVDDFGLVAHTGEARIYQWLVGGFYARVLGRLHHQTGVDFFTTSVNPDSVGPHTADSDVAPFDADEIGLALTLVGDRSPWRSLDGIDIGAAFDYYKRSNDLTATVLSVSIAWRLH